MMYSIVLFITSLIICLNSVLCYSIHTTGPKHEKLIVCYIGTWAVYRPNKGSFALENLDPSLCTHIIYAFAGLNSTDNTLHSLDPWQDLTDDYGKGGYKRIVAIKQKYPHLKVSLAVGGWSEGSEKYSQLVKDPERRSTFVSSALEFIRKYKFDGLDLDWEFPGSRGGSPEDKVNFVYLVKELYSAFSKFNLLLTAAFGASKETIDTAYDVSTLSYYLDYIHLMTYDYHGPWDNQTGPNAPLKNVEDSVKYLIKMGAPSYKVIIGIPLYGKAFVLTDPDNIRNTASLGASAFNTGFQGPFTKQNGLMGYNEICLALQNKSDNWVEHWDSDTETPFAINKEKLVAYDNVKSIAAKVKFAMQENLGGIMVWSIDTDDFNGDCGAGRFPLMKGINKAVQMSLEEIKKDDENKVTDVPEKKHKNTEGGKDKISNSYFVLLILLSVICYH